MSVKLVRHLHGGITKLSPELRSKMRNTDYLQNSLSVGSKNRLRLYQRSLMVSKGVSSDGFDKSIRDAILPYVYNQEEFLRQNKYLDNLADEKGFKFSRNLKLYSEFEPSMVRFIQKDYTSFRWNINYQKSLKSLKEEFSKFKLKPITYKSDDDVRNVLPKANTHSGYYYILSGKKKKGENMEGILDILREKWDDVKVDGTFNTPILVSYRTQASGEYDEDGSQTNQFKHKLRVVSMIDLLWVISEFMFIKPLQDVLCTKSWYAGGKNDTEISMYLGHWRTKFQKYISLDYSSYDQSISGWLLEDMYDVLSSAFEMSEDQKLIWEALVHDAIHKDFILAEGVLHSDRGMASGLPSTQMGDTVINRLIIMTYFNAIHQEFKMMAMGDDNIIFCNNASLLDIASYVSKNFGMNISTDDKSSEGKSRDDPKFLSRFWTYGGTWRHPNILMSHMLFPERFRIYSKEITPYHVIYAYLLAYPRGMTSLIDVRKFIQDHPLIKEEVLRKVDSRYFPGVITYVREYTR